MYLRASAVPDSAGGHQGLDLVGRNALGGLDHEGSVDDEREVDGRRVKAVVDQTLGDIQGRDPAVAQASIASGAAGTSRAVAKIRLGSCLRADCRHEAHSRR